jgi:hypothetical protein
MFIIKMIRRWLRRNRPRPHHQPRSFSAPAMCVPIFRAIPPLSIEVRRRAA